MNTYITIHISKRKKIQLSIDEARSLYLQLDNWLNPKLDHPASNPFDNIKELLQPSRTEPYAPAIPPLPPHVQSALDDFNIKQ